MIEARTISLPLSGAVKVKPYDPAKLRFHTARALGIPEREIAGCSVGKLAVDARHKGDVHFVANVRVELAGGSTAEDDLVRAARPGSIVRWEQPHLDIPHLSSAPADGKRPVIVGAGSAGLFCALVLARARCAPILIERGDPCDERSRKVSEFNRAGILDPESNIQFGAGGAGTFSDGKLTTGTKSPTIPWVTQTFVEAGASSDILWDAHPHIGSDVLPRVVNNLVASIERAGGEVRFCTRLDELVLDANGSVTGIRITQRGPNGSDLGGIGKTETSGQIATNCVILACGHSARDTFSHLYNLGVTLERKPFAMGVRIEHPQNLIDRAQYGRAAGHPALPPAVYKLSCHMDNGRGVYTFCMCPGGTVVAAASEPGGVVTNGMSVFARDGRNANAALLANVLPEDLPGDNPLAGITLQRTCEQKAYELGGGDYKAPAQLVGDFLARQSSATGGSVKPTYPRGVTWDSFEDALPASLLENLRRGIPLLARRLHGFDMADAVLTGVESRSSSPVRIVRDRESFQSLSTPGLYPCGEGAGYAGGIMSAATDGIACARAVLANQLIQ